MKNVIIIIISIISFTIACKAQQPVAKIASAQVKVNNMNYKIIKPDSKVTQIVNSNNKLTNVKQVAPNLPTDIKINDYRKFDKILLTRICAETIPFSTLQKLPKGMSDDLSIYIKVDSKGIPLEMSFLVGNTSLISLNEIQQIEDKIMKSSFKVTFTHGIERYFEGANYFTINVWINYNDILKAKQANYQLFLF